MSLGEVHWSWIPSPVGAVPGCAAAPGGAECWASSQLCTKLGTGVKNLKTGAALTPSCEFVLQGAHMMLPWGCLAAGEVGCQCQHFLDV